MSRKMDPVDMTMNVASMGRRRFHVMNLLIRMTMKMEVVIARSPERVVASPYDGMRKGSMVMMNIPKPNPVVRWTKLAPTVSRNISRILFISVKNHANIVLSPVLILVFHDLTP